MTFKDLEKRLEESGKWADLTTTLTVIRERVSEDYARTLCYFLSIISDLEQNQIRDYAVIGGYGVVLHLVNRLGEGMLPLWRGSDDIDLGAQSLSVESLLKGYYSHFERRESHFHERKIDIEVTDAELQKRCIIDMYLVFKGQPVPLQDYRLDDGFWKRAEYLKIFNMEVPVASKKDLLQMKLAVRTPKAGLPRKQDIYDIFTLLGLLGKEENVQQTWDHLPAYGKSALKRIFSLPDYDTNVKIYELKVLMLPLGHYLEGLRNLTDRVQEF